MMLGVSPATYTFLQALINLIAIGPGLIIMFEFLIGRKLNALTSIFLITTVLTSVTGIGFSFDHLLPSPIIGSSRCWCWQVDLAEQAQAEEAIAIHNNL
jgi:hypothetical protein